MSCTNKFFLLGIIYISISHNLLAQVNSILPDTSTVLATPSLKGFSQDVWNDGLRYNFDDKGNKYIRFTITGQFWARYNQNNPGTLFFDEVKSEQWDFSLRRVRMQLMVQPHERWFVYSQFGINNFNYATARKPSFFLHDFTIEYMPVKNHLFIGAGLGAWGASSRFAAPAVASIMGLDAPLYQQQLNDQTDQFVRNLGVYAKGTINRLNFRMALNKPFAFSKAESFNPTSAIAAHSNFSPRDPALELGTYLEWNFLDRETDKTPYKAGTYLGKKRIFNMGAGIRYRPNAMWYRTSAGDTAFSPMILVTADMFAEMPFRKNGQTAFNIYGAYTYSEFGPSYLRHIGVNGVSTGTSLPLSHLYSHGNSIPLIGTGNSLHFQVGIITPAIQKTEIRFMPYGTFLIADYRVIKKPITVYEAGVNFIIKNNSLKLTAGWQNRPFFYTATSKAIRRNMAVVQMQFAI